MSTPSYSLIDCLKALSSLTAHELHDILAPSLPAVGDLPTIAGQLLQLIVPQSRWERRIKPPASPARTGGRQKKNQPSAAADQLAMPLNDPRSDPVTKKLAQAKTTLASVPFDPGKPTQPQREHLHILFSDCRPEIEAICLREGIPNPWQVPPAQMAIAAIGLIAAVAPPARPGRKKRRVLNIAEHCGTHCTNGSATALRSE